uniref:RNA-binding protein 8A n=1 Tax=Pyramimonas obovata TaxID=1411642 RepID=A0A7S0WPK5_9CHLO|eukprot:CAMPEP_0118921214 /NCGR_PEP_ID=MMETSP1169-20130426/563_1 /TAXON_ID=36882 /ORGANISM="Pyramimonas obovata, Strain CCMP722" /LENGTH=170 /DNA_ID=CAMNT_0006861899 /DNA_START=55 /DNA_END=567 /DNA_ORIENTATION=+
MSAIDYEDDEILDEEEAPMEEAAAPRLKSTITAGPTRKQKGRGFKDAMDVEQRFTGKYESLESGTGPGPAKSVEGWIVMVTGVHEEAQEDDLHEAFAEYGEIQNLHLNLDRRTGFVKGYAMLEYESKKEAQAAIDSLNGTQLLDQTISVTWAFSKGPLKKGGPAARRGRN